MQAGKLNPVTLMEEVIERTNKTKSMNHIFHQDQKAMLEQAIKAKKAYEAGKIRALEGLPIGLKGNVDAVGSPTSGGTPALQNHFPKFNCQLWERLSNYGMINGGKTNLHELSFGTTSANGLYGPARSAMDATRSAGGSSGGSGGVVGTGTLPFALGTDTGGSIRVPATCNGVVGYKPTINRWPADYGLKMTHWRDTIGCLAVSVEDAILVDEVVTDQKPYDVPSPKDIRIGIPNSHFYEDLDPLVKETAERAIKNLRAAGF